MDDLERYVDQQVRLIAGVEDPATRAGMASSLLHRLNVVTRWVAGTRGKALLELRARGLGATEIGNALGVSRQQAHRLLREAAGRSYEPID